jgi:hypothetical protein
MSEFGDKAKTIGAPRKRGQTKIKPVINEKDGTEAGVEVEHWDDTQDAIVRPHPIRLKPTIKEG